MSNKDIINILILLFIFQRKKFQAGDEDAIKAYLDYLVEKQLKEQIEEERSKTR